MKKPNREFKGFCITPQNVSVICRRLVELGVISELDWHHGRAEIEKAVAKALHLYRIMPRDPVAESLWS